MPKFKPITLREREELEPMILEYPDAIEQNFRVITHQLMTDSGPLDILGIDQEGNLVVMELKVQATDLHLDQGLRYYDWCRLNIAWIDQAYGDRLKINTGTPPRLILVAPSFTDPVKRIAKYIEVDLTLLEYHAFEDEKGQKGLVCTKIDFGEPPEPPEIPTIPDKLKYFRDATVHALFEQVLDELGSRGIEVKPIRGLWISLWYKGKRFMYMAPKRDFFVLEVLSPGGGWLGRQRVRTRAEWDEICHGPIAEYLAYIDVGS